MKTKKITNKGFEKMLEKIALEKSGNNVTTLYDHHLLQYHYRNKPILDNDGLRSLKIVLEKALGKEFFYKFREKYPENWDYNQRDVEDATEDAIWSFTYAVEELLEETFEMIIDDICEEAQWNLTQEQKDELEEGKSI